MTAAELIRGAFRVLGVLAAGETPAAQEEKDGLSALNDMLDSWAGERLALFATLRSVHALTPGLSPHTIGPSGTFDTARPVRVDRASVAPASAPGTEQPLSLLSDADWQVTRSKASEGRPVALWVETAYPLMKLHLWPIPSAADSLVLYTWQQLGRLASAAADFDMPPGYARAIRYNLAKELAPEYGVALSAEAADIANESKTTLKRLNHRPSFARSEAAVLLGGSPNLVTGD
jgi:hypothetical protein